MDVSLNGDTAWMTDDFVERIKKALAEYKPGDCIDLGSATGKMFMEELQK